MSPISHAGELVALATAGCWTLTALCFEAASRRVGSLAVNLARLILAMGFISVYCRVARGQWLPFDATAYNWYWLLLSGVVGIFVGDMCLFRAFVLIGARKTMLVMSLAPPLTAIVGWLILGELLTPLDWAGMVLTVIGVAWVVMEQEPEGEKGSSGKTFLGLTLAFLAATGQAVGLVLSKFGMKGYDPFAATQIRILAALGIFLLLFAAFRWWPRVKAILDQRAALGWTAMGAFFGTFLGISLSLLAVKLTKTGIAATIMSIVPILIIPPAAFFFKERITPRAVIGAFVAVIGVSVLFL
ncbi:MAG: DMT family transporter [Deltaproteobacteria bacterium]|nr:DMT family transporter [Deltaproteobacteria bacterium]